MFHSELLRSLAITECSDRRKCIHSHIKMVMEQLEEVLSQLKDVARELREVVSQIDKLTAYIDLDTTDDDRLTLACSRQKNETALGNLSTVQPYKISNGLSHLFLTSSCDSAIIKVPALCYQSFGDLPPQNGPACLNASWHFDRKKGIHSCGSVEHHALCCDDEDFDYECGRKTSIFSSSDSVFTSSPLLPLRLGALTPTSVHKYYFSPGLKKKALLSCSTQTVSDKSTQTAFSYTPARQRSASERKQ